MSTSEVTCIRREGNDMSRVITDLEVYASTLVDELIAIKDHHKDVLNRSEVDSINDACNLIYHNRKEIKKA